MENCFDLTKYSFYPICHCPENPYYIAFILILLSKYKLHTQAKIAYQYNTMYQFNQYNLSLEPKTFLPSST